MMSSVTGCANRLAVLSAVTEDQPSLAERVLARVNNT